MLLEKNKIIEVGWLEKGTGKHQSNVVYSIEGIAPTVCAMFCIKQPPTMVIINEKNKDKTSH